MLIVSFDISLKSSNTRECGVLLYEALSATCNTRECGVLLYEALSATCNTRECGVLLYEALSATCVLGKCATKDVFATGTGNAVREVAGCL